MKEKQKRFGSDLRKHFLPRQDHLAGGPSLEHSQLPVEATVSCDDELQAFCLHFWTLKHNGQDGY